MAKKLRRLQIREVAYVDSGGNQHADIVFAKRKENPVTGDEMFNLEAIPEEFRKSVADEIARLTKEKAELQVEVEKTKPPVPTTPPVEVPEAIAKHLKEQAKEIEKLRADLDAKDRAEEIVKCSAYTVVKHDGLADKLFAIRKVHKDIYDIVHQVLAAAQETAVKGAEVLTKSMGVDNRTTDQGTTYDKIDAMAKSLVKEGKAKDYAVAVAKVLQEQPELYTAYEKERN